MVMTRQMGEFERWASGLASTAVGSWGMRRGGIIGLVALAGAGFLAWRAGTGRSLVPEGSQKLLAKAMPNLVTGTEAPARKTASRSAPAKARAKAPAKAEATAKSRAPARSVKSAPKAESTASAAPATKRRASAAKAAPRTAAAKADAPTPPAGKAMKKPVAARRNATAHRATPANSGADATPKTIN